jgi:vacuolar-type H+-ATPase subunit E/Vma4
MEELRKFIKAKIEEKIKDIRLEGEREKRQLKSEFEETKKRLEKDARKEVEGILKLEEIRRVSKVQMENLDKVLRKREEIFEKITEELKDVIKDANWKEILPNLLKEAVKRFGEEKGIVKVNRKFVDLAKKEIQKNKWNLKVIHENGMEEGVIVESVDGRIRVYNTFSTRLERAKDYLFDIMRDIINA